MYIDLVIKIKNAGRSENKIVKTRYTKMDYAVAGLLHHSGFLKKVEVKGRPQKRAMELELNPNRPIEGVRFWSKPSVERYGGYRDLKRPKGGHGLLALSTPKGILSSADAKREKVGGQILFEVW